MKNILVLTPWFPAHRDGWPARYVSDSALALANSGHDVRVAVLRGWVPLGLSRWVKLEHLGRINAESFPEIKSIRSKRLITFPGSFFRRIKNFLLDASVTKHLLVEIRLKRPDVIIVHTETLALAAVVVANRENLPIFVVLHGENTNKKYLSAAGQAERFRRALGQASRLVIVGEPLRSYAAQISARTDHIAVVWNGCDAPEEQRQVPNPDVDTIEILTVANLQEGKGVDLLLIALGRLKKEGLSDWRLRIIGSGALEGFLRALIVEMDIGDKVIFLGNMSNAEVFARMVESDVFVLPSWREAFGVAYLEAMASGLLTIGVEGQGPAQFINDGLTGILVPPRSSDVLTDRLRDVLSGDRSVWRSVAAAGSEYVRTSMTWQAHAEKITSLIDEVSSNPNKGLS